VYKRVREEQRRWTLLVRGSWPVAPALGMIAVVLALAAGVAHAEVPRLVPLGQFESEGALGVAVDNSTSISDSSRSDVYVAGFLNLSAFTPGHLHKFDGAGHTLSPASFGEAFGYSGTAVSPVNGVVYALDAFEHEIHEYDPESGVSLSSSFKVPSFSNLDLGFFSATVVQIATDPAGHVYLPVVPENKVVEYSEEGVELKEFTGGSGAGALKAPTGVAVDSAGNLWVADAGNERIEELEPSGEPHTVIPAEGVQSVALDGHGDVFAIVNNFADFCGSLEAPCSHLAEYGPNGVQIADVGAGLFGVFGARSNLRAIPDMLAVNESSGHVYVTEYGTSEKEGDHSRVFIYTSPVPPRLENELATEVGASEAKLGAVVNPGGIGSAYRFEYGTTTGYGRSVPVPEGDTGGGFRSRTVWAGAPGLQPGTTYHYRVVLTSPLGPVVEGKDHTFTTETAAQAACPNGQLRTGFSASLPDCRAYELVTPPNRQSAEPNPAKKDGSVESSFEHNFAAVDGNRLAFQAEDVFPGSPSGAKPYVATRGPDGWSVENVFPPTNYYGYKCNDRNAGGYSADLTRTLLSIASTGPCGPVHELVAGEPQGVNNLFVRDNTSSSYQLVDLTPPETVPAEPTLIASSSDLAHVVFEDEAKLTPNAMAGAKNIYEWSAGGVRLSTVLLNGTPVAGSFAGIAPNGSPVFFTYEGRLYARVNGTETVQIDASQAGGPGGGASFISASADGSQAIVSDDPLAGLTADTRPASGVNLYRYDFATRRLTDLTPAEHVELKSVLGVSEDGSYIYFEARGSLALGATQGQANPYVWHAGATTFTTTFISALAGVSREQLEVSRDGLFLSFATTQKLTSYNNADAITGSPDPELYVYSAASNSLSCATCNLSGAPPTGGPRLETQRPQAARNLSDNGRFFFETTEALLPADTNGKQDVYEFESYGVGSCSEPTGCVLLISTGTGAQDTWLIEASPSGNDVFLRETQKLVPRDTVSEMHTIYDVRMDGGLPEPTAPPPCTTPEACRTASPPQPSVFSAPASQTFSGAENLTPAAAPPPAKPKPKPKRCEKGYVKKKNKCVKAKHGRKAQKTNRKGSK
jgi:NHL repeat